MSRVLVTGGAGFIGSHLVVGFESRGDRVTVIDDLSSGQWEALPPGVDLLIRDIAEPSVAEVVAELRPELVVHAAAQASVPASVADPERDCAVNLDGTRHLLRGALDGGGARFVFLSTGGAIYGDTTGADEEAPPRPASPYAEHKLAAEQAVAASGLPYAIARIANVYGPGQRSDLEGGVVAIFRDQLARGEPVTIHGDGEQTRDFIHVEDVARAVRIMAAATLNGTWNVGTGEATSVRTLLRQLEARLGAAVEVRQAPPRPGDVRHSRLICSRAARDLDWQARIPLGEGLDRLTA